MLLSADSWKSVLIDGALAERGMASFSRFIDAKGAEDLRAYVLTEARAVQGTAAAPPAAAPAKGGPPPKS